MSDAVTLVAFAVSCKICMQTPRRVHCMYLAGTDIGAGTRLGTRLTSQRRGLCSTLATTTQVRNWGGRASACVEDRESPKTEGRHSRPHSDTHTDTRTHRHTDTTHIWVYSLPDPPRSSP
eukprot:68847-Rhodomonas_salina.1